MAMNREDNLIVLAGKLKYYNKKGEIITVYTRKGKEIDDTNARYIRTCLKLMQFRNYIRIHYAEGFEADFNAILSMIVNATNWIVHSTTPKGTIPRYENGIQIGERRCFECIIKRKKINEIPNEETV